MGDDAGNEVDQATISGGWLTAIAPCPFHWSDGDPAWVSAMPGIAQHLYQQSADPAVFRRVYDAVRCAPLLVLPRLGPLKAEPAHPTDDVSGCKWTITSQSPTARRPSCWR